LIIITISTLRATFDLSQPGHANSGLQPAVSPFKALGFRLLLWNTAGSETFFAALAYLMLWLKSAKLARFTALPGSVSEKKAGIFDSIVRQRQSGKDFFS